jgi:peptidoglycan LD-endopeptidase LytH
MNRRRSVGCSLALVACLVAGCSVVRGREPTLTNTLRARQLMVPVAGVSPDEVPDTFRASRGGARIHGAVDIPAPRGTPVLSADDGCVLRLHRNPKGGLTIYATDTSEHFVYYYAHLGAYRHGLAKGARLVRGQVIGFVGTTGDAHGREPHLHFQVLERRKDGRSWGGDAIDPRPFFTSAGRAVHMGKRRA